MKYCWFCGTQNVDTSKYCYHCGKQLEPNEDTNSAEKDIYEQKSAEESELIVSYQPQQTIVKPYVPTFTDKAAVASLVLSIIGVLSFLAAPIQILALVLGIKGVRSERRKKLAFVGIALALFGLVCFTAVLLIIIFNYEALINSDIFEQIYYSLY